jgi:hypothetical protein
MRRSGLQEFVQHLRSQLVPERTERTSDRGLLLCRITRVGRIIEIRETARDFIEMAERRIGGFRQPHAAE